MKSPFRIRISTMKDGRTAYDLDFSFQGKRWRPRIGDSGTYTEAQIWDRARAIVQAIQEPPKGEASPGRSGVEVRGNPEAVTLADLLPFYQQECDLKNILDYKRQDRIIERHLLRILGHIQLNSLTYAHGLDYQQQRKAEGVADGTLYLEWGVLMRMLNLAVKLDWLDKNRLLTCPRPVPSRRTRVATIEELLALQAVSPLELWRFVMVALNTGLRSGNIFSLQRDWISENGLWLTIPTARSKLKQHPPKVSLNVLALEALGGPGEGPIWTWKYLRSVKTAWAAACQKAGIGDLHVHDLRHTFATRLQGLRVVYEVRQALLGHRMPGQTATYSHGSAEWDEQLREAVQALNFDYRRNGLVSGLTKPTDSMKTVIGLDAHKLLKPKEKRQGPFGPTQFFLNREAPSSTHCVLPQQPPPKPAWPDFVP